MNCPSGLPISAICGPTNASINLPRRLKTRIQIDGAEDCFEGIDKQRLLPSAAGLLLSLAQVKVPPKFQLLRVPDEVSRADKKALQLRKLALRKSMGTAGKENR